MATGRITEASIAAVRERTPIDKVIGEYVTLKKASAGTFKGLCPFHDEGSPSFHVNPSRGYYHCFGCQAGGDVIKFLQELDSLSFVETIERLAERFGIALEYDTTSPGTKVEAPRHSRARLVAVCVAAAEFYTAQLFTADAVEARRYLSERNFTREDCAPFKVGYSPNGWDALVTHLSSLGFTHEEMKAAGLSSDGKRGPIDRFRGRLMFAICDVSGDVIGFGARKLFDDDPIEGKYINTSETYLYKKSKVLFGLNLARKAIAANRRVVVVEGYTDVMACHLSGETAAVATCGTAFGEEHIRIIRRLLGDDGSGGEVIYTFDGDKAGQNAALKAFTLDDHFQTRTSVAVAAEDMDPCEVRIARGPEGVRALLNERIPLFEFAIKATLGQFNLSTSEGRVNALAATVPILANIRHTELRSDYEGKLAKWTGSSRDAVRDAVARTRPGHDAGTTPAARHEDIERETTAEVSATGEAVDPFTRPEPSVLPHARDTLKVLIQDQQRVHLSTTEVHRGDFLHPTHRAVYDAITAASEVTQNDAHTSTVDPQGWVTTVLAHAASPTVAALVTELAVEPLHTRTGITPETASKTFVELVVDTCTRRLDHIERAITDPNLTPEKMDALLADHDRVRKRLSDATDRLHQVDAAHF